jgi:CHAT domain-containing protein/tetratricopeptide (TPR) repeat protein
MMRFFFAVASALLIWFCSGCKTKPQDLDIPADCGGLRAFALAGQQKIVQSDPGIQENLYRILLDTLSKQPCIAADTAHADLRHKLGAQLLAQKRYKEARLQFLQGLDIRLRLFGPQHRDVLRLYHNLGLTCIGDSTLRSALHFFTLARINQPEQPYIVPYFQTLQWTAITYFRMEEPSLAKEYYKQALEVARTAAPASRNAWISETCMLFSNCLRELKEYHAAIGYAEEGIRALQEPGFEAFTEQLANCRLNLGTIWQDSIYDTFKNDPAGSTTPGYAKAIAETYTAINLFSSINAETSMLYAHRNLGELYRRDRQYEKSKQVLTTAIERLEAQNGDKILLGQLYVNRGETFSNAAQQTSALEDFYRALRCFSPEHQHPVEEQLPVLSPSIGNRQNYMLLLSDLALAQLGQYEEKNASVYLDKAVSAYDSLVRFMDITRGGFLSEESKINLSRDYRPTLEKAFQLCLRLHERTGDAKYIERAFGFAEQTKSIALLEAVRVNSLSGNLPADLQALRQEDRENYQRLTEAEKNIALAAVGADKTARQKEWSAAFDRWRNTQERLKNNFKAYYELKQLGATLSTAEIRDKMLEPGQGLLAYFKIDSVLYVFNVNKNGPTKLAQTTLKTSFQADVDTLRRLLSGALRAPDREALLLRKSHELHNMLLGPLGGDLTERLIIVPDAPFTTLPFEALVARPGLKTFEDAVRQKSFLLFDRAVSYTYSANLLHEIGKRDIGRLSTRTVAAFAPDFPAQLGSGAHALPDFIAAALPALKPLPNAQETGGIAEAVETKLYPGPQAGKTAFLDACRRHKIVHVATHGILSDADPNMSFISFNQGTAAIDTAQLLYLRDLYSHPLDLEFAFFSACETAAGKYVEGEGNFSMARGLAYAGVKSFVTTFWKVYGQDMGALAPAFYREMLNNKASKDVALAEAKRAFIGKDIERYDPAFWAGAVLFGTTTPVPEATRPWGRWAAALFVLSALAGGLLRWRKKRPTIVSR